jgi:hypothetical protein
MKVVTERDAVEVEEKLLRFFSTNEEFIQRSETCVEALSHGLTCDSCERIIDCHDADDSDAVGMDGTAAGTVAAGRSRKMVLLQFAEDQNQNDMQLCMACYELGAPPQGSGNRPWPAEGFELSFVDLRHPHVVFGPQLAEVSDHHRSAHRRVALDLEKQLHSWGFEVSNFDDPSDALIAVMRRYRSSKPAVQSMVKIRIQNVAKACGYEGPINFAKADYEKLKQLDSDILDALSSADFQERVQEIVQSPGSTTERGRALENAIADKECQVLAEHGLDPNFQGT